MGDQVTFKLNVDGQNGNNQKTEKPQNDINSASSSKFGIQYDSDLTEQERMAHQKAHEEEIQDILNTYGVPQQNSQQGQMQQPYQQDYNNPYGNGQYQSGFNDQFAGSSNQVGDTQQMPTMQQSQQYGNYEQQYGQPYDQSGQQYNQFYPQQTNQQQQQQDAKQADSKDKKPKKKKSSNKMLLIICGIATLLICAVAAFIIFAGPSLGIIDDNSTASGQAMSESDYETFYKSESSNITSWASSISSGISNIDQVIEKCSSSITTLEQTKSKFESVTPPSKYSELHTATIEALTKSISSLQELKTATEQYKNGTMSADKYQETVNNIVKEANEAAKQLSSKASK